MSNIITNATTQNIVAQDSSTTQESSTKNDGFEKLLNSKDYDNLLEDTLSTMTDMEKEAHLKTLELLKEQGFDEDKLKLINSIIIFMDENNIEDLTNLELSKDDTKTMEEYKTVFEQIYKAIQEAREERLQFKKLQMNTMMTDTLLKSKDNQDGIQTAKHTLNIEV